MHPHDKCTTDLASTTEADRCVERSLLRFILSEHPAQVTEAEIDRARAGGVASHDELDEVGRALDQLTGAGLLRRQGDSVLPTRAARYFAWLEEER